MVTRIRNLGIALLLMSPFLGLYTLFTLFPAVYAVYYSFYKTTPTGERFVGLDNYRYYLLGQDSRFVQGMRNTLIYGLFSAMTIGLALLIAWLLTSPYVNERTANLIRMIMLLPMIIPWVALGMSLNQSTSSVIGLIKYFNDNVDITHPAASYESATWYVASLLIWASLGYQTMMVTSTLKTLPSDYIDAAKIDGASEWQIFRHVTLPLIKNIIVFSIVNAIILAFNIFDPVATLTGGGPAWVSTSVAFYAGRQLMYAYNYGGACTMGVIVIAIALTASILQYKFIYKRIV
ncbi:MAG: sugar ABC transporter permease [Ignisphaera sp.]